MGEEIERDGYQFQTNNNLDDYYDQIQLTPVSDASVYSAFSEGEKIVLSSFSATRTEGKVSDALDLEGSGPIDKTDFLVVKRKRGRPPGKKNVNSTNWKNLDDLFDNESRRHQSSRSASQKSKTFPSLRRNDKNPTDSKDNTTEDNISPSSTSPSYYPLEKSSGRTPRLAIASSLNSIVALTLNQNSISSTRNITMNTTINNRIQPEVASFLRACRYGQLEIMESMLRKRQISSIDFRDANLNTGLHEAAQNNQVEAIKVLLRGGADSQVYNLANKRPRDLTSSSEIFALLDQYKQMQMSAWTDTVLLASWKGDYQGLKALFRAESTPSSINVVDSQGNSALHYAAVHNSPKVAALLLAKGIEKNRQNREGNSALHLAAWFSSEEMVGALLEAGCDYLMKNHQGMIASDLAHRRILRVFRRFAREHSINNPLLLDTIYRTRQREEEETMETTEDYSNDLENLQPIIIPRGLSREERKLHQLMAIISKSNENVPKTSSLELMLPAKKKRGRPPKNRTIDEQKTIHSINNVSTEDQGKNYTINNGKLQANEPTPLQKLCREGDLKGVKRYLVSKPTSVLEKDALGQTALHQAAERGHLAIVQRLIKMGSKINVVAGSDGETPLHRAARQGHSQVAEFLLSHGANKYVKNHQGRRPLDVCRDDDTHKMMLEFNGKQRKPLSLNIQKKMIKKQDDSDGSSGQEKGQGKIKLHTPKVRPSPKKRLLSSSSPIKESILTKRAYKSLATLKDLESTEPLLQILISNHPHDMLGKWYFVANQLYELVALSSTQYQLLSKISLAKTRHLSGDERGKLLESSILEKFSSIRAKIHGQPLVTLLERDAVVEELERVGFTLANNPVIFVNLAKLLPAHETHHQFRRPSETLGAMEEGILPPKLKMKFIQRRSVDQIG